MCVAFSLLAAAGPAAAQSPAGQPALPQPAATPAPQPAERKPLILELDEASRRQILYGPGSQSTERPAGGGTAGGLPSLGEGARPVDPALRSSPYPKSSDNLP